jgi:hypothetical protein
LIAADTPFVILGFSACNLDPQPMRSPSNHSGLPQPGFPTPFSTASGVFGLVAGPFNTLRH